MQYQSIDQCTLLIRQGCGRAVARGRVGGPPASASADPRGQRDDVMPGKDGFIERKVILTVIYACCTRNTITTTRTQ
jgi:hypothetical protein